MLELKSKIVDYIRMHGPSLPVQLSKQIHSNILFAGAVLSELVANQKVKISNAKIGGSPVYYIPGQESKLNILYSHLNEREKKVYDLLKENKVLYDKALEPWQRVALRDLKDFAYPIQINNDIFWRWYLFSEEEANKIIQESIKQNALQENIIKEELKLPEQIKGEIKPVQQIINEPKLEPRNEIEQPVKVLAEIKKQLELTKPELKEEKKIKLGKKRAKKNPEEFYNTINNYFNTKNINKIEETIVKKNKEFDFVAELNTDIGLVRFFVTVKDKKKINDADLSLAHNKAQLKKLPLMFLSNGELVKSAKEYLKDNYLIFKKI